jgi:hypothetical protein
LAGALPSYLIQTHITEAWMMNMRDVRQLPLLLLLLELMM